MRRSVLHTCLVVLVTSLAFADAADQNTITYDNKTTLERTTLKEQQNIHDDVLRHITTASTTASSSSSSDVSSKPHVTTVNKVLTTPRSIPEEEQLQKILEDTDTTTKSNNEDKIQIHEKYERKLTINETGGRETESSSPQLTNKTSANEVIDVVTYKYNESGTSSSVSSYVTVSHISSYEHSSSVVYVEDDVDDHIPEHHPVSTTPSNDNTDNDENNDEDDEDDVHSEDINDDDDNNNNNGNTSGTNSKNYVNNNEPSRGLLKDVVPAIDLKTSITDKKYTINNVNNDVTVNNKLRPDALDEQESTTNFSISNSSRNSISKGIISLENVNSTYSSNGDSVNQSINSIINSNNVNIDENTTVKPRHRYSSVRKSEESTLSNINYNSSDNSGKQLSSTTVPDLIKLDTINTVPVMEWERIPNVVVNRTDLNSTTVSNDMVHPEVPPSVTQLPSISSVVKPSIAFKNKLRLHPTIRIKTTSPTLMDSSSELLSNESTSEEQSSLPLNGKYNINTTIKTAISSRKRPPKYYYLSQSNSSDLVIPPTATAWAFAGKLDNNPRVVKKSSPVFTTTGEKNDASSEKAATTPASKVKPFISWSTHLQNITTESTLGEDTVDKFLYDSDSSSTSNVDNIQETTLYTADEITTQTLSVTSSTLQSIVQQTNNNTYSNISDNIVSKNKTKTHNSVSNDHSSIQTLSIPSTTEVSYDNKMTANKSESENNSAGTRDEFHEQTSTYSYRVKSTDNSDTLPLDSHMTTAQYYGNSESTVPLLALPSSPAQNDTKNNVIDKYDFNNGTAMKTVSHSENRNQTGSNLLFDMNQTSNEIRSNETLKFKTSLLSDVVEVETKNNNTVNNEPAEVMSEDTLLDSGVQPNEDSEEDTKNNETTVIHILDLPLETTTNPEVIADEDSDNEDEDLHNIIIKTTTPAEAVSHDMNIPDFDSNEDTADDKKLNKDTVEMNEDKITNKNLTMEVTEKPSNIDINWYNVIQPPEDTEKEVTNSNLTKDKELVTASEMEHPQTTPVIIITTSSSSSEAPVTSTSTTTTTTTTVTPPVVADTTTVTTSTTSTTSTTVTTVTPTTAGPITTTTPTATTPTTITSTPIATTTIPSTTTAHTDEFLHIVPAYISLHVETSLAKLCKDRRKLKQKIVELFISKSERSISEQQVILLNVNKQQCMNVTKLEDTVIPVNILLVDEAGQYDKELMEKCLELFKAVENSGFDMYFTVHKVGLQVMQRTVPPSSTDKGSVIAAITLSFIAAVCLLLLGILLVIIRKRQKGFNYGQRCTPVSLDDYSLDNISVYNSVRRKGALRASKRSYGNPAFDDPGAPSHSMNFAGLANFSSDIEALHEEFNQIPMITVKPDELPPGAETKNRYANVIPLPETRVQLIGKEGCDHLDEYINANFVKGPKGAEKFYIACQAPLQSTVNDFWKMIWQQQCKVVLMLTDLQENGVEKCADYLPPCEVLDCHRLFGDFQVTLKKREEREKYVISSLQLKNLETNSWREVMHLWYASWPTQGVPEDCSSIIAYLIEARSFMRSTTGPTVVHCSPGTGRTGTVIAIDICIRDFETTRSVDIPKTVYAIRRDRAGAVQTKDQYTFIYQVLNLYAAKLTGGALDSL